MFGHITINLTDVSEEEQSRYRALYCGLCHTIKERYGSAYRACLTYDLTFLVMLLDSLYEPEERRCLRRCAAHPLKARECARSVHAEYAADLTVLLAYHKCLDDWHDERKLAARGYAALLKGPYRAAGKRRPQQRAAIECALREIRALETRAQEEGEDVPLDAAANRFGILMGELFAFAQDQWTETLWNFGVQLGRFIYAMDAAVDCEDDRKAGGYNPLVEAGSSVSEMRAYLSILIGNAARVCEKLPLVQDIHLIRSVLYAGVWQRFNAAYGVDYE
jgi:hypothetical protein